MHLYYDYAVSSVYVVESDGSGFNAAFLVKKENKDVKEIKYGAWDGIHIVTCSVSSNSAHYNVISTVMISKDAETAALGKMGMHDSCAKI